MRPCACGCRAIPAGFIPLTKMHEEHRFHILLAAAPSSSAQIAEALGDAHRISYADDLAHAKRQLEQDCDLIVCGLYFDESRMFDLLRYAKAEEQLRRIPFLAIKATEGELSPTLQQSIEIACAALGAEKFFELTKAERELGKDGARQRLRALLARLLEP